MLNLAINARLYLNNNSVFAKEADNQAVIDTLDIAGKKVTMRNVQLQQGQNAVRFDRETLQPGTYFVRVAATGAEYGIQKVILQ